MNSGVRPPSDSSSRPGEDPLEQDGPTPSADVQEAVEVALRYLDDDVVPPTDLSPTARDLLEAIAAARSDHAGFSRLAHSAEDEVQAPPRDQDSLAVALGLVTAGQVSVSGPALRNARQRSGLKPSDVARHLTQLGQPTTPGEWLRWEGVAGVPLAPAKLAAIAAALRTTSASLQPTAATAVSTGLAVSRQFRTLVHRWARHTEQSLAAAQMALMQVAAAPSRRGTAQDDEAVIAALQTYVDAHVSDQPS